VPKRNESQRAESIEILDVYGDVRLPSEENGFPFFTEANPTTFEVMYSYIASVVEG
jgi:hypothetical protein